MRDEAITDAPRPAGTVMTVGEETVDAGDARKMELWLRKCYKRRRLSTFREAHGKARGSKWTQARTGLVIGRLSPAA